MFEKRFKCDFNVYSNECVYVEAIPASKGFKMVRIKNGRWSRPSEPVKMSDEELCGNYFCEKSSALERIHDVLESRLSDLKESFALWVGSLDKLDITEWKERKQNLSELVRSMDFITSRLQAVSKELEDNPNQVLRHEIFDNKVDDEKVDEDGNTVQDK